MDDDEGPPPLPPPRTESLSAGEPTVASRDGGSGDGPENNNKWSQQPLPMAPVYEHAGDDENGGSDSETDVESCNSSNDDNNDDAAATGNSLLTEDQQAGQKEEDEATTNDTANVGSPTNGQERSNSDGDMAEDSNDT